MKSLFFLVILAAFIASCNGDTVAIPENEDQVFGIIVDENNNPIADAEICLIPDVEHSIHSININKKSPVLLSIEVVELTSFNVSKNGNHVDINWTTATEYNCKQFIVEKALVIEGEPINFAKIGTVKAKGNSITSTNYFFSDSNVVADNIYSYRLIIEDNDGTINYSNDYQVSFVNPKNAIGNNYPNPFYSLTSIPISVLKTGKVKLYFIEKCTGLSDLFEFELNSGINMLNLSNTDNEGKPRRPGIYQMKMTTIDTTVYGPDILLDYKFTTDDCKIPQYIVKSDLNGKFNIQYKWFGDTSKITKTSFNGNVLATLIMTPKRKIVARKLINETNEYKQYYVAIDSITPIPNKRTDVKLIMKKYEINN